MTGLHLSRVKVRKTIAFCIEDNTFSGTKSHTPVSQVLMLQCRSFHLQEVNNKYHHCISCCCLRGYGGRGTDFEKEAVNTGGHKSPIKTSVRKGLPKYHSLFLYRFFYHSLVYQEGCSSTESTQHTDTGIKVFSQGYSLGSEA